MKYKVHVVCFTFNHSKYIEDTMNGFVSQQTDFPYVCCIVDDASNDGEQSVISNYIETNFDFSEGGEGYRQETDYGMVYFASHKSNRNCYFAVILLKENHHSSKRPKRHYLAQWRDNSEYTAFCEGDDYWVSPFKLSIQTAWLDSHPDYVLSYTGHQVLNQKTGMLRRDFKTESICERLGNNMKCEDILVNRRIPLTCTVVVRANLEEDIRKSDPVLFGSRKFLLGDVSKWYCLARMGKIHYHNEICSTYRELESSASNIPGRKNEFKFGASAWALRAYLCRRDNLSKKTTDLVEETYAYYCLRHQALNPDYEPVIPVSKEHQKRTALLLRLGLLKYLLMLRSLISR